MVPDVHPLLVIQAFSGLLSIMLKKVGARTQPCFMPLEMGKGLDRSPLSLIWLP